MARDLLNLDENGNESNLLMIGCGPYAQSAYIPTLNAFRALPEERLFLRTVVEIDTNVVQTRQALDRWAVRSGTIDVKGLSAGAMNEERDAVLDAIRSEKDIDAVLITTEPSAHVAHAQWALRNRLHILMDKPIAARANSSIDESQAWGLLDDFKLLASETIAARKEKPDLAFNIAVQRRYDPDMLQVLANVKGVFEGTGQFPTTIEMTKADGSWRLPRELLEEEYHGYQKGYGILSHSGYHMFDLASQIIKIADGTPKQIDSVNVTSSFVRPSDVMDQITPDEYRHIFHGKVEDGKIVLNEDEFARLNSMGEVDAHVTIECMSKGKVMTIVTIHLLHNSLSARRDAGGNADKYLGAGRTKYESVKIFQGPVAQHEYVNNHATGAENSSLTLGVAHDQKKPFITIKNKILAWRGNLIAKIFNKVFGWKWKADLPRLFLLKEFVQQVKGIDSDEPRSDILSHLGAVSLMASAYASGARRFNGQNPMVTIPYATDFEQKEESETNEQ